MVVRIERSEKALGVFLVEFKDFIVGLLFLFGLCFLLAMGNCEISEFEGEKHLIVVVKHIAKALGSKKNLTDNARKILEEASEYLNAAGEAQKLTETASWGTTAAHVGEGCDGRRNKMGEKELRGDDGNWWVQRRCPAVAATDLL